MTINQQYCKHDDVAIDCPQCATAELARLQKLWAASFSFKLRAANLARIPDFEEGNGLHDWSLAERSNELAGEVGELANVLKKIRRLGRHAPIPDDLKAHALEELGDVYIAADLIAAEMGWSPAEVREGIRRKFNLTSDKIGSKVKL